MYILCHNPNSTFINDIHLFSTNVQTQNGNGLLSIYLIIDSNHSKLIQHGYNKGDYISIENQVKFIVRKYNEQMTQQYDKEI